MELNEKELIKQMRENMLKEDYARVEVIVNRIPAQPYCNMEIHGLSLKEVGILYLSLKETLKNIEKQYPLAVVYAHECIDIKNVSNVEYDKTNGGKHAK